MSPRRTAWFILVGTLALSVLATLHRVVRVQGPPPAEPPRLTVGGALGGAETAGFARAMQPRAFVFPADHGPHPDFRSEWWYVTGQLRAGARRFGYQLTIFRQALAARTPARGSAWGSRQVYMGHLAITDVDGRRFVAHERLAREGLGLAGAGGQPVRVWVEDWSMTGARTDLFPLTLRARASDGAALELTLAAGRGPVLQGDRGLSVKGAEPGNASYYYSCTRLPTSGRVEVGGSSFPVAGESWLDREWSTSALGPELAGWDWLALHLSDGRDLMVYRLRRRDGRAAPQSRATVIDARATTRLLGPEGFTVTEARWWQSPQTGTRYPVALTVDIPSAGLRLAVRPLLDAQELRVSVQYWEGAVEATGSGVRGTGYLELTGYQ
jgi:predicted secreted hydrolase